MRVLALMTWRGDLQPQPAAAAMAKRASWSYPPGATVAEEYWTLGNDRSIPVVVCVYEDISTEAMLQLTLDWGEYFDVRFAPAMTATEGLAAGERIMQRVGISA
ncbi:MAG: DUF3303 family protein [Acidimicrobiales bacterium]